MKESVYKIPKMDCPSEENLIRLKLKEISGIQHVGFDLGKRELTVWHQEEAFSPISSALEKLNLGSKWVATKEAKPFQATEEKDQRKLLWTILSINFLFFLIEILFGLISGSMGLVADSLDMLADALVYGLSLLAVGTSMIRQKRVALVAGVFQAILAVLGFLEVIRRFLGLEELPDFRMMMGISFLALLANAYCLYLLQKSRAQEAHMRASMIFTSNDVLINLGVIAAGAMVFWLNSRIPDLVIGTLIFVLVSIGAVRILKLSK
jgi:Co/Zn/Cd efflux system component